LNDESSQPASQSQPAKGPSFDVALGRLLDSSSPKRRSAAKALRKFARPEACTALLTALEKELLDERTWETQYQMIMALGTSGCERALPTLRKLARMDYWAGMRQVAVGDALIRLQWMNRLSPSDILNDILELFDDYDPHIVEGAMRAVAMLHIRFDEAAATQLIAAVERLDNFSVTFWAAGAAAGWRGVEVERFLQRCAKSSRMDLARLAAAAMDGHYKRFTVL
jgi:HEAT repeat protein